MINKVILIGRVGQDPEVRQTANSSVVSFSLATSETYKNKNGEKITNTEWHNIQAWRSLAEIIGKYVKKGQMIYVEGKLKNQSWEDSNGQKHYKTYVEADNIRILQNRKSENAQEDYSQEDPSEDLPF